MKNKTEIMKSVNGVASKTVMKLKKHSPEILVVAGIAGSKCRSRLQGYH